MTAGVTHDDYSVVLVKAKLVLTVLLLLLLPPPPLQAVMVEKNRPSEVPGGMGAGGMPGGMTI
jgi:hypothetical protein